MPWLWIPFIDVAIGLWLIVSPFVFGVPSDVELLSIVLGILILAVAFVTWTGTYLLKSPTWSWTSWIDVILGLGTIALPFLFRVSSQAQANYVISGLVVAIVAFVNWLFILFNVAVLICEASLNEKALTAFVFHYGVVPSEITGGVDLWTLASSMFVYGGWMHLIGNMLFLWVFGDNIEAALGHIPYAIFYFLGGLAASAAHHDQSGERYPQRRGQWRDCRRAGGLSGHVPAFPDQCSGHHRHLYPGGPRDGYSLPGHLGHNAVFDRHRLPGNADGADHRGRLVGAYRRIRFRPDRRGGPQKPGREAGDRRGVEGAIGGAFKTTAGADPIVEYNLEDSLPCR